MRTNPLFALHYIACVPYLLPHGQLIADHYRGTMLNETGVFIWNEIYNGAKDIDSITDACMTFFEADLEDRADIYKDVSDFIVFLKSMGAIQEENINIGDSSNYFTKASAKTSLQVVSSHEATHTNKTHHLNIAGIDIFFSSPDCAYADEFIPFETKNTSQNDESLNNIKNASQNDESSNNIKNASQNDDSLNTIKYHKQALDTSSGDFKPNIYITIESFKSTPVLPDNAFPIVRNADLDIFDCGEDIYYFFPASENLKFAIMRKSDSSTRFFFAEPSKESEAMLKQDIFHATRLIFLYTAHMCGMLMLHSASFLYQGRAWLFSASSGTGKSTHTNIWKKLYGTPIIDGDLNLFTIENGIPVVKGIPWCGTSGIFDTETHPLGGIVLLKRAPSDSIDELSPDKKRLLILQRLISPAWNENHLNTSINIIDKVADNILVCRLNCTKEDSAAICMKSKIDEYLSTQ